MEKLFRLYQNQDLTRTLAPMGLKERLQYVVSRVTDITGLSDFCSYLTMLLEMDAFFLNEDRHMNNIAVLRNSDKSFSYCPIFDNGAALFSDTTISYPLNIKIEHCYDNIEAKPFSRSFDEQIDAAEELYGVHFSYWFQKQDIRTLLDEASTFYPPEIIDRVYDILLWQIRKYQYFRRNH